MRIICMLIMCLFLAQGMNAQGVKFQDLTLEQALKKAKKEKKKVFLDCMTDKCIPCLKAAKEIFPTKECGDYFNKNYVCVQVNLDKHPDGKALYKRFKIGTVPTFIVLTADDELCGIKAGISAVTNGYDMVRAIENAISTWNALEKTEVEFAENKKDFQLAVKYANLLQACKKGDQIPNVLKEYYEANKDMNWYSPLVWNDLFEKYVTDITHPLYREIFNIRWKYALGMGEYTVYKKLLDCYEPLYQKRFRLNPAVMEQAIADLSLLEQDGVERAHWLKVGLTVRYIIANQLADRYDEIVSIFENQVYKCPDVMWRINTYAELDQFRKLDPQKAKHIGGILNNFLRPRYREYKMIGDMRDSCAPLSPLSKKMFEELEKRQKEKEKQQ